MMKIVQQCERKMKVESQKDDKNKLNYFEINHLSTVLKNSNHLL